MSIERQKILVALASCQATHRPGVAILTAASQLDHRGCTLG
jgi:hypothetical protein